MGFDRNTIIGFVLLGVLFMGYFWYVSSSQKEAAAIKKRQEDSIAALKPKADPEKWRQDSTDMAFKQDSAAAGELANAVKGEEAFSYIENNLARFTFSNKGGWLKQVELKKYKGPDSQFVKMGGAGEDFGYGIRTSNTESTESNKLFFHPAVINKTAGGSQTISYQMTGAGGKTITHSFVIKPDDYMLDAKIDIAGADQMLTQQTLSLHWNTTTHRQQSNVVYEKEQSNLVYKSGGDYDFERALGGVNKQFDKSTDWIGLKQQFFNSTLIVKPGMSGVQADVQTFADTINNEVASMKLTARVPVGAGNLASIPMQLYYGPNDYYILKKYDNDMFNIVDLGSGIFAFVKYINRWLILPVFSVLGKFIGSMGWAILVLTIIIRLLIAPLTYSSYLSGAKMKALRPEIDAMKARVGNDQQAMSMEQMKLFREAGVNPLGGCIPALFQIPIFFALYSFFNSNIDLRGVPFLWTSDLSSYDSILTFGFNIPFYGNHVSLFTITACITSFFISLYSMSSTPDTGNPMMKYMPYIFPFLMLFIFNKLPSALTWYYTVSNLITLGLQFVIQNYIIDHDKILAKITLNRSAPKKKSKWQERVEAMQESQKKLEDLKKKTNKR